jgi:hypothetical protein
MKALKCIGMGVLGAAFVALLVFVTMSLWNWLVPELFHGPVVSFWQAAGLLILSKILLSGFHHRGGRHHYRRHHHGAEGENDPCCDNRWWAKYRHRGHCCGSEKKQD